MAKKKEKYLDGNSIQGADVWFLSAAVIWNVFRKSKIILISKDKLNSNSMLEPAVLLLTISQVPGRWGAPSVVTSVVTSGPCHVTTLSTTLRFPSPLAVSPPVSPAA